MLENHPIDETVLFITYTDQSEGGFGQRGNPMLGVLYDMDENLYGPLCQVFSRVYRYDFYHRANRIGVAETNREIIKLAEMYRPKYVFWPTNKRALVTEDTLLTLRKMGLIVVIRCGDEDTHFDNYSRWWAPCADYVVINVREKIPQYESLGVRCVLMALEGHNEGLWQRLPHIPKQFDVTFVGNIGNLFPDRRERLAALKEMGIPVRVFDSKGGQNKLPLSDVVKIFNQTRINLNFTHDSRGLGIRQLKSRMIEVTMCGGFLLTEYARDLELYFEIGREVVCFDSTAEAAEKIHYYLEHPSEREAIAARGYERAQRDYTARVMFHKVFSQIEQDLQSRGRPTVPAALPAGVNPMREQAAKYHYRWAQLMLRTPAPLRNTWRESIELVLANNPAHEGARRMLRTNEKWGDPEGPFVRLANAMISTWGRTMRWIYIHKPLAPFRRLAKNIRQSGR